MKTLAFFEVSRKIDTMKLHRSAEGDDLGPVRTPPAPFTHRSAEDDALAAARGIGLALILMVPVWAVIFWLLAILLA